MPPPSVCPLTRDARQASRRGYIGKCDRLWSRKRVQTPASNKSSVLGVVLLLGVVCSWSPKAIASVIYTYTGNDYTTAATPYSTSDRITGNFELLAALGDNLSNQTVTPIAFSFNDGVETITQATATLYDFLHFNTDAAGNVTQWQVDVLTAIETISTVNSGSTVTDEALTGPTYTQARNDGAPGAWSLQPFVPVPEPSTLAGLGSSLFGFMVLRRRRKTSRRTY